MLMVVFFKVVPGLPLHILRGSAAPSCEAQNDKPSEKEEFYLVAWSAPRRPALGFAALLWIRVLWVKLVFVRLVTLFVAMTVLPRIWINRE